MKSLRVIFALFLLLSLATVSVNARVSPLEDYPSFQSVGSGDLTWWGIRIYRATLYAPLGHYGPKRPHALEIVYRMAICRELLAKTSLEEIERIRGRRLVDREAVLDQLETVFRDVSAGDAIVGLHLPGEGARFYTRTDYLGRIDDPELAAAFFGIWLGPASPRPGLRSELLGQAR
ncbi:MAG: chalcone isomerase family protein [Candidatus Thiodiazotropha sp.]